MRTRQLLTVIIAGLGLVVMLVAFGELAYADPGTVLVNRATGTD